MRSKECRAVELLLCPYLNCAAPTAAKENRTDLFSLSCSDQPAQDEVQLFLGVLLLESLGDIL